MAMLQSPEKAPQATSFHMLGALPTDPDIMVAEDLFAVDLINIRKTMNKSLVEKTIVIFAKTSFDTVECAQQILSREMLERLEASASRPMLAKHITTIDFDLNFPYGLDAWRRRIKRAAVVDTPLDDDAKAFLQFAKAEKAFWEKPESWTRLAQALKKCTRLSWICSLVSSNTYGAWDNRTRTTDRLQHFQQHLNPDVETFYYTHTLELKESRVLCLRLWIVQVSIRNALERCYSTCTTSTSTR